jgi:hypothetical protein
MRRETLILLAVFSLLGLAFVFLKFRNNARIDPDRTFHIRDKRKISEIYITHRDGVQVTLRKDGASWIVNDTFRANPNIMENLLDAISRIQIKYAPPQAAVPYIIQDLAKNGIRVELFDRAHHKIMGYYVGGSTADERGTHIIRENSDLPFVGELAGWEGNLRFRFRMRGDEWRDKTIFQYRVRDVAEVELVYPKHQLASFRLTQNGASFQLSSFSSWRKTVEISSSRGIAYLSGFEKLGAEAFETGNPYRDSIERNLPFVTISLKEKKGNQRYLKVWPIYPRQVSAEGIVTKKEAARVERYFAGDENGSFYLIQDRVFRKIFRGYDYFIRN